MLAAGLVVAFALVRTLTRSHQPLEREIRPATPVDVQVAPNDAASPDRNVLPVPAAPPPEAEMPASDAGAGAPLVVADATNVDAAREPEAASDAESVSVDAGSADAATMAQVALPVVYCGPIPCAPGKLCCNPSCGICVDPGQTCSKALCSMPGLSEMPVSINCGPNTCNVGRVCCNPTCGICVSPGQTCDQTPCSGAPEIPISFTCGMATCNVGMVCCNASCGICAPPGELCSTEVCD
jgi:hypothetical protein